jgi:uncharacterized protein
VSSKRARRLCSPGVYFGKVFPEPGLPPWGVPIILGYATRKTSPQWALLTNFQQFDLEFKQLPQSFLKLTVCGFFANGGDACYVVGMDNPHDPIAALESGLKQVETLETADLVCAPDIMHPTSASQCHELQVALLEHCDRLGDRFAILDARGDDPELTTAVAVANVKAQKRRLLGAVGAAKAANGALYFPWLDVSCRQSDADGGLRRRRSADPCVPPCGFVAGVYAQTDRNVGGVHKAPANVALNEVVDLRYEIDEDHQAHLNGEGINCIRSFPGRGIRIFGARTLASNSPISPEGRSGVRAFGSQTQLGGTLARRYNTTLDFSYINVRRLIIELTRWLRRTMDAVVFEPNGPQLWARVQRELEARLSEFRDSGALAGETAEEAFFVKCDAETNPQEVRDRGELVSEIGIAPSRPGEFLIVRVKHAPGGVSLAPPDQRPP